MCCEQMRCKQLCVCGVCYTNSVSIGKHRRQLSLRWVCQTAAQNTKRGKGSAELKAPKRAIAAQEPRRGGTESPMQSYCRAKVTDKRCRAPLLSMHPLSEEYRSTMRLPETKKRVRHWRNGLLVQKTHGLLKLIASRSFIALSSTSANLGHGLTSAQSIRGTSSAKTVRT